MATRGSIAARTQLAIQRINAVVGELHKVSNTEPIVIPVTNRDTALLQAMQLEAIADNLERFHPMPEPVIDDLPEVVITNDTADVVVSDDLTKAQIAERLDALGVEYNPNAKKADLIALLESASVADNGDPADDETELTEPVDGGADNGDPADG